MSEQMSKWMGAMQSALAKRSELKHRLMIYAALGVSFVLVAAYLDGGEEPIRPIEQEVAVSQTQGAAQ